MTKKSMRRAQENDIQVGTHAPVTSLSELIVAVSV